jgi:hypothetical protein
LGSDGKFKTGLKPTKVKLKYDASLAAPKRDFKGAEIKKKGTVQDENSPARNQKKKNQPSAKDKFSMSVHDMLAEGERTTGLASLNDHEWYIGWDGRTTELESDAGTGKTPDYCPRYNCVPDVRVLFNSWLNFCIHLKLHVYDFSAWYGLEK